MNHIAYIEIIGRKAFKGGKVVCEYCFSKRPTRNTFLTKLVEKHGVRR